MDKPPEETDEVQVIIRMPAELRRRLKVLAAMEEKAMKDKVQEWIEERWEDHHSEAVPA